MPYSLPKVLGPLAARYANYPTCPIPISDYTSVPKTKSVTMNTGKVWPGYTRIWRRGFREEDKAPLAILEYRGGPKDLLARMAMIHLPTCQMEVKSLFHHGTSPIQSQFPLPLTTIVSSSFPTYQTVLAPSSTTRTLTSFPNSSDISPSPSPSIPLPSQTPTPHPFHYSPTPEMMRRGIPLSPPRTLPYSDLQTSRRFHYLTKLTKRYTSALKLYIDGFKSQREFEALEKIRLEEFLMSKSKVLFQKLKAYKSLGGIVSSGDMKSLKEKGLLVDGNGKYVGSSLQVSDLTWKPPRYLFPFDYQIEYAQSIFKKCTDSLSKLPQPLLVEKVLNLKPRTLRPRKIVAGFVRHPSKM